MDTIPTALVAYLGGVVYPTAVATFERHASKFVRGALQHHAFPPRPPAPNERRDGAGEPQSIPEPGPAVSNAAEEVTDFLNDAATAAVADLPRWVQEARAAVGSADSRMEQFVTAESEVWDLYVLVEVMCYHLRVVFAPAAGLSDFQAKELLMRLLEVKATRTLRAHARPPTELEVLDALGAMRCIARLCGGALAAAAAELDEHLAAAKEMYARADGARAARAVPAPHREVRLTAADARALVLYQALCDFWPRFEALVGPVREARGRIDMPATARWSPGWQQAARRAHKWLKCIARARNKLFHGESLTAAGQAADAMAAMRRTLVHFSGAVHGREPLGTPPPTLQRGRRGGNDADDGTAPAAWPFEKMLAGVDAVVAAARGRGGGAGAATRAVPLRVQLTLSGARMRIPALPLLDFVGRKAEARQLAEHLERDGARVLVCGMGGVGKDSLVAEVVRGSGRIDGVELPWLRRQRLAVWVQGTTSEALERQLVGAFHTLLPGVLRGLEGDRADELAAVRAWLAANDDWLVVVEDATRACTALAEWIPQDTPRGRVVVTSRERLDRPAAATAAAAAAAAAAAVAAGGGGSNDDDAASSQGSALLPPRTEFVGLEQFDTETSQALLERMRVAGDNVSPAEVLALREAELQRQCEASEGAVVYDGPPAMGEGAGARAAGAGEEDSAAASARHERMAAALVAVGRTATAEKETVARKRLKDAEAARQLGAALRSDELTRFLEDVLGNLPLSVALAGHMLREMGGDVGGLVAKYDTLGLSEVDEKGRARGDRHYLGLVKTMLVSVQRMADWCNARQQRELPEKAGTNAAEGPPVESSRVVGGGEGGDAGGDGGDGGGEGGGGGGEGGDTGAVGETRGPSAADCGRALLMMLSLLHESETPVALFQSPEAAAAAATKREELTQQGSDGGASSMVKAAAALFAVSAGISAPGGVVGSDADPSSATAAAAAGRNAFELAAASLVQFGLVHEAEDQGRIVGVVHQQVQRAVREHFVLGPLKQAHQQQQQQQSPNALEQQQQPVQVQHCTTTDPAPCAAMAVLDTLRGVLEGVDQFDQHATPGDPAAKAWLRALGPSVERWVGTVTAQANTSAVGATRRWAAHELAAVRGEMLFMDGDFRGALQVQQAVAGFRKAEVGKEHSETLSSLGSLACTLSALGRHDASLAMMEEVLHVQTRMLGNEHPDTLTSAGNLACTFGALGRHGDALALQRKTLQVLKRVLGEEHPDTLASACNVALALSALGRRDEALALQEEALRVQKRVLGEEHPDTLATANSLTSTLHFLGRYGEALLLQKEVLQVRKRVLGEEHPATLTIAGNVAATLSALGQHGEALQLQQEVLRARKRVLGEEHPSTLVSAGNMAITLGALGRHDEALPLEEEVLRVRKHVLGEEHPDTLTSAGNLALTLAALGRRGDALPLQEGVFRVLKRVFGEEHPDTLLSEGNLARAFAVLGRAAEALPLQEEVLRVQKRVLGEEHPDTLTSATNLAITLGALGQHSKALPLQEEVLRVQKRVLGDEHPDTLTSADNLAGTLLAFGQHDEALTLQEEVLRMLKRVCGEEHPGTLTSASNLALTFSALDQPGEALVLQREVLKVRKRVLGEEHPDTLDSMHNVAGTLYHLGRFADAQQLMQCELAVRERVSPGHPQTALTREDLSVVEEEVAAATAMRDETHEDHEDNADQDEEETITAAAAATAAAPAAARESAPRTAVQPEEQKGAE